ncbi:hypothetical protein KUBF_33110 [Bacteroides finegoldii]|nr:hypothetical protein KUBF_33110 [Bacteroides finegoldii]
MSAVNPLSAEFLYELYATALRQEPLCAVLARHMRKEYLPDRSFQQVQEAIAVHFKTYKTPPSYAVLAQTFHEDYDAIELIDTFREYDEGQSAEVMTDMLESYIKGSGCSRSMRRSGNCITRTNRTRRRRLFGNMPSGWQGSR